MGTFAKELETLINKHDIDGSTHIPDFILADMLCEIIDAIAVGNIKTLYWHGCDSVCHPKGK